MTDFKTPYGLIGRKLGHSISPEIHAALGNPHYSLYELEPDELPKFLADTRLKALNVTIPYKIDVIPLCASLDPLAEDLIEGLYEHLDAGLDDEQGDHRADPGLQ